MTAEDLVIEALADENAGLLEARRQLIDLVVDLCGDLEVWKRFAATQYHGRLTAERQRDRAYERLRQVRRMDAA